MLETTAYELMMEAMRSLGESTQTGRNRGNHTCENVLLATGYAGNKEMLEQCLHSSNLSVWSVHQYWGWTTHGASRRSWPEPADESPFR